MLLAVIFEHFFVPHERNNHRARLISPVFLIIFSAVFWGLQFLVPLLPQFTPVVLGYTSEITPEKIVDFTNRQRQEQGVVELRINEQLTKAALAKGSDMMARDYWAHTAPDGTEPWYFFTQAGYRYRFAGENLARDFSDPRDVVEAWMASPTHRENLLSSRYQDIGVGVVEGELNGVKTVVVVQLFGTPLGDSTTAAVVKVPPTSTLASVPAVAGTAEEEVREVLAKVSPMSIIKGLAIFSLISLIFLFVVDVVLVRHKNIARVSSRSLANLAFLIMVLAAVLIVKSGIIL